MVNKIFFFKMSSLLAFLIGLGLAIYLFYNSIDDLAILTLDLAILIYALIMENYNPFFVFLKLKGGIDHEAKNEM